MKKIVGILLSMIWLTGCASVQTWETLGQVDHTDPYTSAMQQVVLQLPEEAVLETAGQDLDWKAYQCDGYWLILQNFQSGDLSATVRSLSGFSPEQLTIVESDCGDHQRYDLVWTAVSEEGEMVCRATVLDDGTYHYTLCAMTDTSRMQALQNPWNGLFSTFCLTS